MCSATLIKFWLALCVTHSACSPLCIAQAFCMVKQHYRDNSYYSYHPNCSSPWVSFLSLHLIHLLAHPPSPQLSLCLRHCSSPFSCSFSKTKTFSTPVWGIGSIHPHTSRQSPRPLGRTIKLHMGGLRLVPLCIPLVLSSSASPSLPCPRVLQLLCVFLHVCVCPRPSLQLAGGRCQLTHGHRIVWLPAAVSVCSIWLSSIWSVPRCKPHQTNKHKS